MSLQVRCDSGKLIPFTLPVIITDALLGELKQLSNNIAHIDCGALKDFEFVEVRKLSQVLQSLDLSSENDDVSRPQSPISTSTHYDKLKEMIGPSIQK